MITALDHVAIAVEDFDAAVDGYRRLLGREPDLEPGGGAKRAESRGQTGAPAARASSGDAIGPGIRSSGGGASRPSTCSRRFSFRYAKP